MADSDGAAQILARVFARRLNFHSPNAKALLYEVLTGKKPEIAADVDGIKIATMAGVPLIPGLPVEPTETLVAVKKRIAAKCPEFPEDSMVLFFAPKSEAGTKSDEPIKLREVPEHDPDGQPQTMGNLTAVTDTLFIVRMTPHKTKQTTIRNEYERGDIDCPRCKRKGPSRYTGHEKCETCQCCGMCCILVDRCGVPADVPVPTPDAHAAAAEKLKAAQEEYTAEFYKWQRGIMKPY